MIPIKKTGMTDGQPNTLGGGGRFKQMVAKTGSPALSAFLGRKLYGKRKMTKMAVKGKKDNEKDKSAVAEGAAHEAAESKKKEAKE